MRSLVVLSMLITAVVTLTVGVRLLLAARRTRQIPELLYGTAFRQPTVFELSDEFRGNEDLEPEKTRTL